MGRLRKRARRAAGQYGLMEDERDPHDNYETPATAVRMLLDHVDLVGGAWDPSCGRGNITMALMDSGMPSAMVCGSDSHHYTPRVGSGTVRYGVDFLATTRMPTDDTAHIVMNPPFDDSDNHVRHALKLIPSNGTVCALLRLTWMAAKKRADLLLYLRQIIICGRLKMLPPEIADKGHGGAVDFAWFIFKPGVWAATNIVRAT